MEMVCANGLSVATGCGMLSLTPILLPAVGLPAAYTNRKVIKRGLKRAAKRTSTPTAAFKILLEELAKDELDEAATPHKSLIAFAQQKTSQVPGQDITDTVNRLTLVGMQRQKCVCQNELPKGQVESFLRHELASKNFPEAVIETVIASVTSSKDFRKVEEDFTHTPDGKSNSYKYAIWLQDRDDVYTQVAFICSNASFQSARIIEDWTTVMEPIFHDQEEYEQVTESGWFFNHTSPRKVIRRRQIGEKEVRSPVYRQHVLSPFDGNAIKEYMEYQVCMDALSIGF